MSARNPDPAPHQGGVYAPTGAGMEAMQGAVDADGEDGAASGRPEPEGLRKGSLPPKAVPPVADSKKQSPSQ